MVEELTISIASAETLNVEVAAQSFCDLDEERATGIATVIESETEI